MSTEEFTQWTQIRLRHYKEIAAFQKQAIGHQRMKAQRAPDIVSNRLNSNDNPRGSEFLSKRYPERLAQAFGFTLTEFTQQFAIMQKELSHYFWNGENILPMRYWIKNLLFEVMAKLDHLFVITAGTKPPPSATEGKQIFVLNFRTFYSGKALTKIATLKVFLDNLIYKRAVKTIPVLEKFVISTRPFPTQ